MFASCNFNVYINELCSFYVPFETPSIYGSLLSYDQPTDWLYINICRCIYISDQESSNGNPHLKKKKKGKKRRRIN